MTKTFLPNNPGQPINQRQHTGVKALLLSLLMAGLIAGLSACQNEGLRSAHDTSLTSAEHATLQQQAKHAVLDLDYSQLERLTAQIDVNRPLPDQSSLLAWAVETQDPKLVSMLLERGANAQTLDGNRFTPLIEACRYGNSEIINALLDNGAQPDNALEDGTTAFQLCAGSASAAILKRMISLGSNVATANQYGQTALMFAANAGNVENLQFLVNNGADINRQTLEGYSPLFFAIKSDNVEAAKTAISLGADLSATAKDGTTAAQLGVYTANYSFLIWFTAKLDTLMTPAAKKTVLTAFDRDGYQLLHAAVNANQPELVSVLLAQGANPLTISEPSTLSWRYEANFKTEDYIPPQLSPIALAEKNQLTEIAAMLRDQESRSRT